MALMVLPGLHLQANNTDPDLDKLPVYIYDAQTKEPLEGVSIRIKDQRKLIFSNQLGQFFIPLAGKKEVEIELTYIGYEAREISVNLTAPANAPLVIRLEPKGIDLSAVTISAETKKNIDQLNAVDLQLRPIRSSQEILRQVPGLFIAQHAGGGKAEQIFLRGFDIDHGTDINLSVDGMPVNMVSHAHGQGYSDLHFLIPETVGSIEFDKGPYHADKGNFTTAGYAGFNTQNSLANNQLKLELGQYNTFRGLGMIKLLPEDENHHAYVAAEYLFSDGYFDASQNFNRVNVFAKYTGNISPNTQLKFSASSFSSTWDASGQIPERAVERGLISRFGAIDSTEGGETARKNLNLQLFHSLSDHSSLETQIFYSQYDFQLFSNFTFFLEDEENGDQIMQQENRQILGSNIKFQNSFEKGKVRGLTQAGLSLRVDQVNDIGLFQTKNRTEILNTLANGDLQEANAGFFVSQKLDLGQRFQMEASLRYDQFRFAYQDKLTEAYDPQSLTKGIFSPSLKLSLDIATNSKLYLNLGRGFHSNDTRVILEQRSNAILPKAYGADLGIFFKPVDRLLVQAALWYLDLEQEFVYVGDAGIVEPSGQSQRMGIDFSARYQITNWLFFDTDLNLTRARAVGEASGADYIPLAPAFSSIGGLTVKLDNGFSGSLRYRILGDRPANEDYSLTADGYELLDAVLQYETNKFRIGLSAENILNVAWKEAQFETTSRLPGEAEPVTEIHYTPGSPLFARLNFTFFW